MITPNPKSVIVLATVLVIGCVVGGLGFVLGRDSAEPAPAGQVVRAAKAEQVAKARKAGFERGFAAGRRAAERSQGRELAATDEASERSNGQDALAVSDFELDPGVFYIVAIEAGDRGSKPQISDYAPMESGRSYQLCAAYGVCQRPR